MTIDSRTIAESAFNLSNFSGSEGKYELKWPELDDQISGLLGPEPGKHAEINSTRINPDNDLNIISMDL
jgi:hypothetical protein